MASMGMSVHARRDSLDLNVRMMWMNALHCPVKIMEIVPIEMEVTLATVLWASQVSFIVLMVQDWQI